MSALSLNQPLSVSLCPNSVAEKNFGLSESDFQLLAEALVRGDQRLFERVFLAHYQPCLQYLMRKDGIPYEKAYDLTMDTLLRFRELIIAGKLRYGNLRYLFTRMARQASRRDQKSTNRTTGITEVCLEFPTEEPELSREEFDLLSRAFKSLGKDCRELLRSFYFIRRSLKDIAVEEDRTAAAVRKQKSRCIVALRRYFNHLS